MNHLQHFAHLNHHQAAMAAFQRNNPSIQDVGRANSAPSNMEQQGENLNEEDMNRTEIFVQRPDGKIIVVAADADADVMTIKNKVFMAEGIHPINQTLYFHGRALEDKAALMDCGVSWGSTLHLISPHVIPAEPSLDMFKFRDLKAEVAGTLSETSSCATPSSCGSPVAFENGEGSTPSPDSPRTEPTKKSGVGSIVAKTARGLAYDLDKVDENVARRLSKNRISAERSRQRKIQRWNEMVATSSRQEQHILALTQENQALKERMARLEQFFEQNAPHLAPYMPR
mmetsp:Transcript_27430/g.55194  ORF Transcript_27430/g.55194 Transcript_27430/m.55194 type:complete len:285 (+) Transcript_27430:51-905(+)